MVLRGWLVGSLLDWRLEDSWGFGLTVTLPEGLHTNRLRPWQMQVRE